MREGKKGKGLPCMNVQDIAGYFNSLSKNIETNSTGGKENNAFNTPKRKTDEETLDLVFI